MKGSDIYYLALLISLVGETAARGFGDQLTMWVFVFLIAGNFTMQLLSEWKERKERRNKQWGEENDG